MTFISDRSRKKIMLAPMAGITDKPFRKLCRNMGAHACVSEMNTSNPALFNSRKSQLRMDIVDDESPRIVQIAGADPVHMAEAARYNVGLGAEIIDINMGCPAKKVCNVMAGSSLLRDEPLVQRILESVVAAAGVPVTLKIRTGWDPQNRNALTIACIAEASGIQQLTVHGRTRACKFNGRAEHDTVTAIKASVRIPVIANGDIDSAAEAVRVLQYTSADGVMVGRAAFGNPWIFQQINSLLESGSVAAEPGLREIRDTLLDHLRAIHEFYGEYGGVRIARKHIGWYCSRLSVYGGSWQSQINRVESADLQLQLISRLFEHEQQNPVRIAA